MFVTQKVVCIIEIVLCSWVSENGKKVCDEYVASRPPVCIIKEIKGEYVTVDCKKGMQIYPLANNKLNFTIRTLKKDQCYEHLY